MICLAPVSIENPHPNALNPSKYIQVPCGSCPSCLRKRSQMWIFRLMKEREVSSSSYFLTLTYDDEYLPRLEDGRMTLDKRDHQLFMKRLRKMQKEKLKYYAVGEYGGETERPHFHSIMFNLNNVDNVEKAWKQGHVRVDECNVKTIAYTTKYVMKQLKFKDRYDGRVREHSMMSKGLGKNFLTKNMMQFFKDNLQPYITDRGGTKLALPRYYKDKIFDVDEKNEINRKSKQYIENNVTFESFIQEHEWKKDQYRKRDKIAKQKRKL